jgi:hypothetical protein
MYFKKRLILSHAVRILLSTVIIGFSASVSAGVIPTIKGGKLIGASNVDLGSLGLYSFHLARGSCLQVFGQKCRAGGFTFNTVTDASIAAQALLDQVFVGRYDDITTDTYGCSLLGCSVPTPYGIETVRSQWGMTDSTGTYTGYSYTNYTQLVYAHNYPKYFYFENFTAGGYPDSVSVGSGAEVSYFGYNDMYVPLYAVWERQDRVVEVPEPSVLGLLVLGAIGLSAARRKGEGRRQ